MLSHGLRKVYWKLHTLYARDESPYSRFEISKSHRIISICFTLLSERNLLGSLDDVITCKKIIVIVNMYEKKDNLQLFMIYQLPEVLQSTSM